MNRCTFEAPLCKALLQTLNNATPSKPILSLLEKIERAVHSNDEEKGEIQQRKPVKPIDILTLDDLFSVFPEQSVYNYLVDTLDIRAGVTIVEDFLVAKQKTYKCDMRQTAAKILPAVPLSQFPLITSEATFKNTAVWIALENNWEVARLKMTDLPRFVGQFQPALSLKLEENSEALQSNLKREQLVHPYFFMNLSIEIGRVPLLSKEELLSFLPYLSPLACSLISREQLQDFNMRTFTKEQLEGLICTGRDAAGAEERWKMLTESQIADAATKGSPSLMKTLPLHLYRFLPLSKVPYDSLSALFPDDEPVEITKAKVQQISAAEISKRAFYGLITVEISEGAMSYSAPLTMFPALFLHHLSDDQIRELNYNSPLALLWEILFPSQEASRRINLLSALSISHIVQWHRKACTSVPPQFMKRLSTEKIAALDMSQFLAKEIKALFPSFDPTHYFSYITDNSPNSIETRIGLDGTLGIDFTGPSFGRETGEAVMDEMERRKKICMHRLDSLSLPNLKIVFNHISPEIRVAYFPTYIERTTQSAVVLKPA